MPAVNPINGPPPASRSASRTSQRKKQLEATAAAAAFDGNNNNLVYHQLSPSASKVLSSVVTGKKVKAGKSSKQDNYNSAAQEYDRLKQEYDKMVKQQQKQQVKTMQSLAVASGSKYWDPDDHEYGNGAPIKVPKFKKKIQQPQSSSASLSYSKTDLAKGKSSNPFLSTTPAAAKGSSSVYTNYIHQEPTKDPAVGWTKATEKFRKASSTNVVSRKNTAASTSLLYKSSKSPPEPPVISTKVAYMEDYKEIRSELMNLVQKECKKAKSKIPQSPTPSKSIHSFMKTPLTINLDKNDVNLFQETVETKEIVSKKLDELSKLFRENLKVHKTNPNELIKTPKLNKLSNKSLSKLEKDVSPKIFSYGNRVFPSEDEEEDEGNDGGNSKSEEESERSRGESRKRKDRETSKGHVFQGSGGRISFIEGSSRKPKVTSTTASAATYTGKTSVGVGTGTSTTSAANKAWPYFSTPSPSAAYTRGGSKSSQGIQVQTEMGLGINNNTIGIGTKTQGIQTQTDAAAGIHSTASTIRNLLQKKVDEIKFTKDMSPEEQRQLEELRLKKKEWESYKFKA